MKQKIEKLVNHAMNCLGFAVTIIDPKGILLYYNNHAATILDRKPEYIGREIFDFHKKETSNKKIKTMLHEFKNGRKEPFTYKAKPYGNLVHVTVSPIIADNEYIGCVQLVSNHHEK